ncbi:MAG: Rrf2 family transcriptional regulator [Emcibacter sp.]|nr:Rrf2 family transcriptional regulator [Emcibacter sp.]
MKLQRSSRLALYSVLELASKPDRQLSASDIATKFDVSLNHLAKVLRDLGKARLVEAVRGAGGGYRFCGNARRTTLKDIVEIFEPITLQDVGGFEPGDRTEFGLSLGVVLGEIDDIALATLDSITLETMLNLTQRVQKQMPQKSESPSENVYS